jgi:hypothetical protein
MGELLQFDQSKRKNKDTENNKASTPTFTKPTGILSNEELANRRKQRNEQTLKSYRIK